MIKISVLSEREVMRQDFKDMLVISIVSPGREHPPMQGENIYKFKFHDVTEDMFVQSNSFHGIMPCMNKEMAESIAEIAMNNRYEDRWVIHCEAGISRSPGVAIGLASVLKTRPSKAVLMQLFPCFNIHVAKLIEDAMRAKVKEITAELDMQVGCDGGE
jgi:predicted protein tyrosine phosphatase